MKKFVRRLKRWLHRYSENVEWWRRYNAYLLSPEWQHKRKLVLTRSKGMCENCGWRKATQVHHLTYKRVGHEWLWDLMAVCETCHSKIHRRRF